ncbi:hypothetical protein OC861_003355 [Tilletia horrida]|nr:hypothetical protein OC861_003355 [Tilletia horrida]
MSSGPDPILDAVRAAFPALVKNKDYVYSENAGGSQVLGSVAAKMGAYLLDSNVQMADYDLAHQAEARVNQGYAATALLLGQGVSADEVLFGASATQLVENLSRMIEQSIIERQVWNKGDEIIITDVDHETNRGSWKRLADRQGLVIQVWKAIPIPNSKSSKAVFLDPESLNGIVTPRTRLVAFTACSNVLGGFVDVPAAVRIIKEKSEGNAWTCLDAVACAPHRRIKPLELGVDFVFWSWYKVYGPHIGSMYLPRRAQTELLTRLNHHFLHGYSGTYPFQPSSQCYEAIYALTAVVDYYAALGKLALAHKQGRSSTSGGAAAVDALAKAPELDWSTTLKNGARFEEHSEQIDAAFEWMQAHETALLGEIMGKLRSLADQGLLEVVGDSETDADHRAATIAFVKGSNARSSLGSSSSSSSSKEIHSHIVQDKKRGAQQGHMYAYDLITGLGLSKEDGVVRISLVHYNSVNDAAAIGNAIEAAIKAQ